LKISEFRCINSVETKNQRMTDCGRFLGTVVHQKRVVITCPSCKQQYAIVGDNLEIKRLVDTNFRLPTIKEVT